MYARKIPLLQVLKYMPKSVELQNAIAISNAADVGDYATLEGDFVSIVDAAVAGAAESDVTVEAAPQPDEGGQVTDETAAAQRQRGTEGPAKASRKAAKAQGETPLTYAQVREAIEQAPDPDTLKDVYELIRRVPKAAHRDELTLLHDARKGQFDDGQGDVPQ
jgi:hypothetical protein